MDLYPPTDEIMEFLDRSRGTDSKNGFALIWGLSMIFSRKKQKKNGCNRANLVANRSNGKNYEPIVFFIYPFNRLKTVPIIQADGLDKLSPEGVGA